MKVTRNTIEQVANLARLKLTETETDKMTVEMGKIIEWVDKLRQLDTNGIKPMEHVIPMNNIFREDIPKASYDREKILKNAPSSEEGCFKVPKVVE